MFLEWIMVARPEMDDPRAAWEQLRQLGARAATDRAGADAALQALFERGTPPVGLDGPKEGMLVAPLIHPVVDGVVRRLTALWMPWKGKRFHAAAHTGDNVLARSARWPSKLLWPRYRTRKDPLGRIAFDFETRVERGGLDPDLDVLVIDYAREAANPRRIIRQVRDELVQIAPGTYLGKILYKSGDGYRCIGWFALREPS
jgi:hypothetical protein